MAERARQLAERHQEALARADAHNKDRYRKKPAHFPFTVVWNDAMASLRALYTEPLPETEPSVGLAEVSGTCRNLTGLKLEIARELGLTELTCIKAGKCYLSGVYKDLRSCEIGAIEFVLLNCIQISAYQLFRRLYVMRNRSLSRRG